MIIYVDMDRHDPPSEQIGAARTRITYRLEDLAQQTCLLIRYSRVSPELIANVNASAIFLSGNRGSPADYDPAELIGFNKVVQSTEVPIFAFCGGMQAVAVALDAPVEELTGEGRMAEFGYWPVTVTSPHPVFDGLTEPVMRHAHRYHVPAVPAGFTVHASTPMTPVQTMINDERRIVATQFHPEYWTEEFPAGRRMIENFLGWISLGP